MNSFQLNAAKNMAADRTVPVNIRNLVRMMLEEREALVSAMLRIQQEATEYVDRSNKWMT